MNNKLKTNLIAIGLVTGLSIFSIQNTLSRPMLGIKGGEVDSASMLTRMDYNDDGVVTEEDLLNRMLESAEKRFNRMDSDDNSLVSLSEFSNKRGRPGPFDHEAVKQCIAETVGDSFPIPPSREEAFAEADSDADESINSSEYATFISNRAAQRFSFMDTDSDGILSEEEMTGAIETRKEMRQIHRNCAAEQSLLME